MAIPNSICFAPDGRTAYHTDTRLRIIHAQDLDEEGAPSGEPRIHVDLREEELNPDGSVTDSDGCLWNAQWGAGRVARYDPEGAFMGEVRFPVAQVSCPALGGPGMTTLFATTAWQDLGPSEREPEAGSVFAVDLADLGIEARGWAEPRVRVPAPA